jgi:hypothetical protein
LFATAYPRESAAIPLITQRSVVQIHPPQPKNLLPSISSANPATIRIDNFEFSSNAREQTADDKCNRNSFRIANVTRKQPRIRRNNHQHMLHSFSSAQRAHHEPVPLIEGHREKDICRLRPAVGNEWIIRRPHAGQACWRGQQRRRRRQAPWRELRRGRTPGRGSHRQSAVCLSA